MLDVCLPGHICPHGNGLSTTLGEDRKSTRLNSSHRCISYAVFCLKKKSHYRQKSRLQPGQIRHPRLPSAKTEFHIRHKFLLWHPFNTRQITSLPAILRPSFPHCNPTTISCSAFLLTPKPFRRKIPAIAVHFAAQGEPRTGEGGHRR